MDKALTVEKIELSASEQDLKSQLKKEWVTPEIIKLELKGGVAINLEFYSGYHSNS